VFGSVPDKSSRYQGFKSGPERRQVEGPRPFVIELLRCIRDRNPWDRYNASHMSGAYEAAYREWLWDPEGFWARAAESIHWYKKWDKVLDASRAPFYRWFSGGLVNTCYNLLDR